MVDFQLEATGGATVLRLVHSGFGRDSSWDDEYDGVRRGGIVELASLKHYIERNLGEKRKVLWVCVRTSLTAANAWARLAGGPADTNHLVCDSAAGMTVQTAAATATPVAVIRRDAAGDIVARVPSWNDALLRVSLDPAQGSTIAGVFISLYGDAPAYQAEPPEREDVVDIMRRAFPEASSDIVVMES